MRRLALCAAIVLIAVSCGGADSGLEITDARIGKPLANTAALYFSVENGTETADRLVRVETDRAELTQLHESVTSPDGIVTMNEQAEFEVGPGETLALEPGARHVMLLKVDPLEVGETVDITLEWAVSGIVEITADVVPPGLVASELIDD